MIKRVPAGESTGAKFAKQPRAAKRQPRDGREIVDAKELRKRAFNLWHKQSGICCICGKWLSTADISFEHTDLRSGGRRNDTIERYKNARGQWVQNGAAHIGCNGQKGSNRL